MSSYGKSISYTRRTFGTPTTGGSQEAKEFAYEVILNDKPQKVRFFPGRYGICSACRCGVMVNMEGKYKCHGHVYDEAGKILKAADGKEYLACGHTGVLSPEEVSPTAVNFSGFAQPPFGSSNKGAFISDPSMGGQREVPSLTTHYNIKVRQHLAHNVYLYGTWHKVVEERKKPRSDGKGDFTSKNIRPVRCGGALGCQNCKAGIPKQQGLCGYINAGPNHSKNLEQMNKDLSMTCKSCKEGRIFPAGFTCASCGDVVHNLTELSLEDRNKNRDLEDLEVKCPGCGYEGRPDEVPQCVIVQEDDAGTTTGAEDGCGAPLRSDLFDFDIKITKKGEGTASALIKEDASWPDPEKEAAVLEQCEPIDFSFLWDPTTTSQGKKLSADNPFEPKNGAKQGTVSKGSTSY